MHMHMHLPATCRPSTCHHAASWSAARMPHSAATLLQLTYPLDTLRLRLAVDPSVVGMRRAARILMAEGSGLAFYRGIGVAMLGGRRMLVVVDVDECTWA